MENDEDDDGGLDAILPIDAESTGVTSRNNKLDSALDTSKKLWQAVADLVECNDIHEIFDLTLCASARIHKLLNKLPLLYYPLSAVPFPMGENTILS
jgi:hypothetical protein